MRPPESLDWPPGGLIRNPQSAIRNRLFESRLNDRRERIPRSIQPALYRSQIAAGNLGDLLVRLPLQLSQHEHLAVMLGKLSNRRLDQLPQVALAIQVIRARSRILELQRPVVLLPRSPNRLEEHQRIPRPVPQLVLRQVGGDRVDPGRKLLRPVEAVQVPVHADENLLHEVLRSFPVADGAEHEVQKTSLVPLDELLKRSLLPAQKCPHDPRIIHGMQPFSNGCTLRRHGVLQRDFSHWSVPRQRKGDSFDETSSGSLTLLLSTA